MIYQKIFYSYLGLNTLNFAFVFRINIFLGNYFIIYQFMLNKNLDFIPVYQIEFCTRLKKNKFYNLLRKNKLNKLIFIYVHKL